MLETKFAEGARLIWTPPGDGYMANPNFSTMEHGSKTTVFKPDQGVMLRTATRNIQVREQPFTAKWLDYTPYMTTVTPLTGDTLTGYMSGCWIITFTQNGTRKVAHVGTANDNGMNQQVKQNFGKTLDPRAQGFDPYNAWTGLEFQTKHTAISNPGHPAYKQGAQWLPQVLALVTQGGDFYSILMLRRHGSDAWVSGGIKRVQPSNAATVRQALGVSASPSITLGGYRRN